jgi:uncharacterized delta-60 repeat protein
VVAVAPASGSHAATGALDPTFGRQGVARVSLGSLKHCCPRPPNLVARQPGRGSLVTAQTDSGGGDPGFVVIARFDRRGRLDRSFGNGGLVVLGYSDAYFGGSQIVVRRDGRIVVGGTAFFYNPLAPPAGPLVLVQLTPDGAVDRSFGTDGYVTFAPAREQPAGSSMATYIHLLMTDDGGLLAAATASESGFEGTTSRTMLVRFNPDGSLDTNFGPDGTRPLRDAAGVWTRGFGGTLFGTGTFRASGGFGSAVYAFTPSGAPDPTFGQQGMAILPGANRVIRDIAVGDDGGPVVVAEENNGEDTLLLRFLSDGRPDRRFQRGCARPMRSSWRLGATALLADGTLVTARQHLGTGRRRRFFGRVLRLDRRGCLRRRRHHVRLSHVIIGEPFVDGRRKPLVAAIDPGVLADDRTNRPPRLLLMRLRRP